MKFLKTFFGKISCDQVIEDQLTEARRAALEHEAAAEHHDALATMYRDRVRRLEGLQAPGLMMVGIGK